MLTDLASRTAQDERLLADIIRRRDRRLARRAARKAAQEAERQAAR